jgi:hypothetical protein
MLEPALADDVELGIGPHRALDQAGHGGPLELGQVLAGEVRDEIGGGVDRSAIDRLHDLTLAGRRASLPVRAGPSVGCRRPMAAVGCSHALQDAGMSPTYRTPDGERQVGPTWESLIDRQIREAAERGEFDDLPHRGEPLPLEDDALAGDYAMAYRMLRDAGYAPPWIEADKEVRALLARRDELVARAARAGESGRAYAEKELARLVEATNVAIDRLDTLAPTDRQQRVRLDPAAELAALRSAIERGLG